MNPLITTILGGLNLDGLVGRFFPSKEKAQEFEAEFKRTLLSQEGEITKAALAAQQAQIEVNKVEAASASLFVSGWRPHVGWVCGFALSYVAILEPIARFVAQVFYSYNGAFPVVDTTITLQVLLGLLGLGGLRTFEKVKGVDRSTLKK
jgi:hypothetical protein